MLVQKSVFNFTGGQLICLNSSGDTTMNDFNKQKLSDIIVNSDIIFGSDCCSVMYILVPKDKSSQVFYDLVENNQSNDYFEGFYTDLFFAFIEIPNKDYNVIITNWDDDYLGELDNISEYEVVRSGGMADDADFMHQVQVVLGHNKYSKGMKEFCSRFDQDVLEVVMQSIKENKEDDYFPSHVYMDHIKNIETLHHFMRACEILHLAAYAEKPNDQTMNSVHLDICVMIELLSRALTIKSLTESSEKINNCELHYCFGKSDKKYNLSYDDKGYVDVRYGRNLENGSDISVSSPNEAYAKIKKTVIEKYKGGYEIMSMTFADNENPITTDNTIEKVEITPSLLYMFQTSSGMGPRNQDQYRTYDYVKGKCMEELGELNVEIQIEQGQSYKEPGKDGVRGEAVDLAITAMDMFALSCDNMSPEEMQKLFLETMTKKLDKWIRIVTS